MINVAIIGAGQMGRRHTRAVSILGFNLIGIIDKSKNALLDVQKQYAISPNCLYDDLSLFFSEHHPDCVIISTTADSHCNLVEEAVQGGVKYILVEKPLARSIEECEKIIAICSKNGVRVSVNHQMRFMELYSQPKFLLNSPDFGGFKSMTVVGGNFGAAMNGTHYFEAFRFISDHDPIEVSAWFDDEILSNPRGRQFEDRSGSIRVTNSIGQNLYLEIGAGQGHGLFVTYAARNGIININEFTGELRGTVRKSEFRALPTNRYSMPSDEFEMSIPQTESVESTSKVLNALISGVNSVTAEHGMLAIKVLIAAHVSAQQNGRTIKLSDKFDSFRIYPWA